MTATQLLATLIFLLGEAAAYMQFDPVCASPESSVHYVSGPQVRGTLEILWSCLFTILACTWTIQHLNIPEQRDRRKEKKGRWRAVGYWAKWNAKSFWTTAKWMIFTTMAPEFILGKAFGEFMEARRMNKEVEQMRRDGIIGDDEQWSITHGFFGMMGGFRAVLTPQEITRLRKHGKLPRLPDITAAEIDDRSKGNALVKALAVVQVLWVCLQVIVRTARHLPISQFELSVAAFSICAVLTYAFFFSKPQGVVVPMRPFVTLTRSDVDVCIIPLLALFQPPGLDDDYWDEVQCVRNDVAMLRGDVSLNETSPFWYMLGAAVGSVVFGAVHIAAWNFEFPTPTEALLWHVASVAITVLELVTLLPMLLFTSMDALDDFFSEYDVATRTWGLVWGLVYILARLYLLVETFRTLAFLPPDAFVSTWASNIPYVG